MSLNKRVCTIVIKHYSVLECRIFLWHGLLGEIVVRTQDPGWFVAISTNVLDSVLDGV